ncbi:MAG: GAF domain-containing protein [Deltaproteobacteria bacterium]|nr:GAF domain-containing protein [Deltaproteobacteria bacterium]
MGETLERRLERLELLYEVGIALSAEDDKDRLVERILLVAKDLCNADGGTLYLRSEDNELRFAIMRTDSLGIALGGTTGKPIELPPLPLVDPATGEPNEANIATCAAIRKESFNIPDAYDATGFDFSGTKKFDERAGYRSKSFLTIPMLNHHDRVIGVLQLLNAQDEKTGEVVPFEEEEQRIVEALASQAAVALDNQLLLEGQKELLEAFIQMIAAAIDSKSPYTGAHCERVPILTLMLAQAAVAVDEGPFADFTLTEEEWYELKIAAWLHDCGKVTTPVHVMDKATKLETIFDRIEIVRARFEVLKRDAKIRMLEAQAEGDEEAKPRYQREVAALESDLDFIEKANIGSEFLSDEAKDRIRAIGSRQYVQGTLKRGLLAEDEIENLSISRGTLTEEERLIINGHMVQTIQMLEALPFPRNLRRVPEYAGGHHEKMDAKGYPRGVAAGDMSVPARIMAIADVFEALTAQDRPYKKGKTLSESMRILSFMKRDNHLDPDLLDLFVRSGVYQSYAEKYLPDSLIDEVDEDAILSTKPKEFEPLDEATRAKRKTGFLPEYEPLRRSVMGETRSMNEPEMPQLPTKS